VRLFREAGDKVEADIANAGSAQNRNGAVDIFTAVHAAGSFQLIVNERLRPKANSVKAHGGPGGRLFGTNGFGIRFERDLLEGARKGLAQCLQYFGEELRFEKAGCAATNIKSVYDGGLASQNWSERDTRRFQQPPLSANFPADCFCIWRETPGRHYARMEIAIGALRLAKRHL